MAQKSTKQIKHTQYWTVTPHASADHPLIQAAARCIAEGGLVAFPTETVYGLGADASSTSAVEGIFHAKGRPQDNPLIVHLADLAQLDGLVAVADPVIRKLIAAFWPGPLTLVLPLLPELQPSSLSAPAISPVVTAGLDTVALRMPSHPLAQALIRASGCLIAAPSANRSGKPSPTKAEHVADDLAGRIDGIIDGGATSVGLESTVVAIKDNELTLLRPGSITAQQLQDVIGEDSPVKVISNETVGEAPRSPGMKYIHYAPKGQLTVVQGDQYDQVRQYIQAEVDAAARKGERTGILTYSEHAAHYRADAVIPCGSLSSPEEIAAALYDALRAFDKQSVSFIMAEACLEEGIGQAVMNRLRKAASHPVVQI